jgi:hypothetical protein
MRTQLIHLSATLRLPASSWRTGIRGATNKKNANAFLQLLEINVSSGYPGVIKEKSHPWIYNAGFSQIRIENGDWILLSGILPRIVRVVHLVHESGFAGLSTKDDELLEICDGYRHPCKAFDDLQRRGEYRRLFDTRRRGLIPMRGAVGSNRNKSESNSERGSAHPTLG